VHWTWENVSTQPARDAIAALRMAVPELVVVQPPPVDASAMDLSPASHKVVQALQIVGGLAILGLAIWVLLHLFL
jgi:hypothetical protein